MELKWIDKLGDGNPQLLRELKGRLKPLNLLITAAISLLGQILLVMSLFKPLGDKYPAIGKYCQLRAPYRLYHQLQSQLNQLYQTHQYDDLKIQQLQKQIRELEKNLRDKICPTDAIDMQMWWQDQWRDIFVALSVVSIFAVLVVGTYMLINDLAQEERRGTLNFIRLSPQSTQTILSGKLLGVPILLYLATVAAVPVHLWSGLAAQIPLGRILIFDVVLVASCICFYSAALLFGLVSSWLGGFQAWLGSGMVLGFLMLTQSMNYSSSSNIPIDWLKLLNPFYLIPHLGKSSFFKHGHYGLEKLQWFYLPPSANVVSLVGFAILNYCLCTWFIWQSVQRCFRDQGATMLSKRQSYVLTACFEAMILGFAFQQKLTPGSYDTKEWLFGNLVIVCFLNGLVFFYLIAALSPHRQALQDWARYRRERISTRKSFWNSWLVKDLIWAEKSPALLAIALNLVIAITPLAIWVLLWPVEVVEKSRALFSLGLAPSLVMIYAGIAQLMLFMRTQNRVLWATGTVGAAIILPPIILGMLLGNPEKLTVLWLFSVAAPLIPLFSPAEQLSKMTLFLGIVGQLSIMTLLSIQTSRQLRKAGESASKALLAGRSGVEG